MKRLIGLPGETWRMENGVVYIDGKRLVEPYIQPNRRGTDTRAARTVPPGTTSCWATTGRSRATRGRGDRSRSENLIGKVFAVYWPPNRISLR